MLQDTHYFRKQFKDKAISPVFKLLLFFNVPLVIGFCGRGS